MIDYTPVYEEIKKTDLEPWLDELPQKAKDGFNVARWGDLPKWKDVLEQLPQIKTTRADLTSNSIMVGKKEDCENGSYEKLRELLKQYHPWRKGPFTLFDIRIETEWRSDMKWDRLKNHISSLKDKLVLDVGCGNGYHCWRMKGEGARLVIGIDPTPLYVMQFQAVQKYLNDPTTAVFPIGVDDMPQNLSCFDTVFSMGLLYHRRSPLDHLLQLKSLLKEQGELVLETLVVEGKEGDVLSPNGRYAKMPNVWFIPSVPTLESWLTRMGFMNVRCVDVTKTTEEEQRATEWMGFQSLGDFLDPNDSNLTIEGYPAPRRAIFLANNS